MKIVKPDKISVLYRTFEHDERSRFVLTLMLAFDIDHPRALISEVEMWTMAADELTAESCVIDEGNVKVRSEVLLNGHCHPPGDEPVVASFVRVKLGPVDKRLAVFGDRFWTMGVPSNPIPFRSMPVDWTRAFGGEGFAKNPIGRGMGEIDILGHRVHPLPNVEDPEHLIRAPSDRPDPAGFGAYGFTWPQRFAKAGTYDRKWLETRYPGFAHDMDATIFNAAPEDQYLEGYLEGGETFLIENMHPERSRIEGQLPDVVTRAFVTQKRPDGEERFVELSTRLDTVRFIPHRLAGIVVFRAVLDVFEDDASDLLHLVTACEAPGKPRSVEHYQHALALRLDKEKGALMALKNEDLMPDAEDGYVPRPELMDVQKWVLREGFAMANERRAMERKLEEGKARVAAAGMDPDEFGFTELPAVESLSDPYDVDAIEKMMDRQKEIAEREHAEMERGKADIEARARAAFAEQELDYDEEVEKAMKENAGPPKFSAEKHVAWMTSLLKTARDGGAPMEDLEAMLADPKLLPNLRELEQRLLDLYVQSAHMQMPMDRLTRDDSAPFRAEVEVARHNEITLEHRDFSGADLSDMELDGMGLEGAFLEAVDLSRTSMQGANLAGAVLAHAHIEGTNLSGSHLTGVNLGGATIKNADLSRCQLVDAVLSRTKLENTKLEGALLERVSIYETVFGSGIDLSNLVCKQTVFVRLDMRGVKLAGADLSQAALFEVDLRGVDFSGANLTETAFIGCQLEGARFRGVVADRLQLVYETTAAGTDFSGASLNGALLRGLDLRGACFDHAQLDRANLASSNLTEASLYQARAREAIAIRTCFDRAQMRSIDMLGAILQKARFIGADLTGANLFGVDLAKAIVDGTTVLTDASLERSRQIPKAKPPPTTP